MSGKWGLNPRPEVWKTPALPLSYSRFVTLNGAECWTQTNEEDQPREIYSLLPLSLGKFGVTNLIGGTCGT